MQFDSKGIKWKLKICLFICYQQIIKVSYLLQKNGYKKGLPTYMYVLIYNIVSVCKATQNPKWAVLSTLFENWQNICFGWNWTIISLDESFSKVQPNLAPNLFRVHFWKYHEARHDNNDANEFFLVNFLCINEWPYKMISTKKAPLYFLEEWRYIHGLAGRYRHAWRM